MSDVPADAWIGLAVALGCGLLIGIERERRKGRGPTRGAAGVRTFSIAALAGAIAQTMHQPELVAIGALAVVLLAALSYRRSRSEDPGLTTELALVVTYMIGVQAVSTPVLAGACAAVLAGLLAARERMHRFATRVITEQELDDSLLLSAVALVAVPLAPVHGPAWLDGIAPRSIAVLVLLILLVQAAGHVAGRILGSRAGLSLSGFLGGFVSSTATVASMGTEVRRDATALPLASSAAVLSTAATWVQPLLMALVVAPQAVLPMLPVSVAGASVSVLAGLALARGRAAREVPHSDGSPLRLREALLLAGLLALVAGIVSTARAQLGDSGLYAGVALTALADSHAPIASALAMLAGHALDVPSVLVVAGISVTSNSLSRTVIAGLTGGARFAAIVGATLLVGACAAWAVILLLR